MPWGAMPVLTAENMGKILGITPSQPRVQHYDAAHAMPLFWAERKAQAFWGASTASWGAGCIVDTTPGCGTAACAAMAMDVPYIGLAKNSCHAKFLANVTDRSALHMMRTKGCPLFHQEMAKVIEDHFSTVLKTIEHMESAEEKKHPPRMCGRTVYSSIGNTEPSALAPSQGTLSRFVCL